MVMRDIEKRIQALGNILIVNPIDLATIFVHAIAQ